MIAIPPLPWPFHLRFRVGHCWIMKTRQKGRARDIWNPVWGIKKIVHWGVQCRNRQWDVLCEVTRVCIRRASRTPHLRLCGWAVKKSCLCPWCSAHSCIWAASEQHLVWITPGEGTSIQYVYFVPDVFLWLTYVGSCFALLLFFINMVRKKKTSLNVKGEFLEVRMCVCLSWISEANFWLPHHCHRTMAIKGLHKWVSLVVSRRRSF